MYQICFDSPTPASLSESPPPIEQYPQPPGAENVRKLAHKSNDNTQADLKDALESLHKLASAVRRSAAPNTKFNLSSRFSRIEGFYEPYYESLAKVFVRHRFPNASVSLCDQIGKAMSQRRSWILFTQRRGVKLARNRDMFAMAPSLASDVSSTGALTSKGPPSLSVRHALNKHRSPSSFPASVPRPTLYRQLLQGGQAPTSTARLKNRLEPRNDDFHYPEPPVFDPNDSRRPCPYCLEPLTEMTKEAWTRHYDEDTQPFICLSEDCKSPLKFFSSYISWEKHMVDHHDIDWTQKIHSRDWACGMKHPEQVFEDKADFEKHLRIEHDGMSDPQIRVLLKRKQRIALREPAICPLCESFVKGVTLEVGTTTSQKQDPRKQLWHHISEHLHSLLKVCVPIESLTEAEENPPSSEKFGSNSLTSKQGGSSQKHLSQSQGSETDSTGPLYFDDDDGSQFQGSEAGSIGPFDFDDDDAYQAQSSPTRYEVHSTPPDNKSTLSPEYVCLYDGCRQRAFRRAADLDRHIKHVHLKPPDVYFCDYNQCPRSEKAVSASMPSTSKKSSEMVSSPSSSLGVGTAGIGAFGRKDHLRAHYRDYHREDLCRLNGKEVAGWFDDRNISSNWWRCIKCLRKIAYSRCGWECRDCGRMLEPERINARKRRMGTKGS